MMTTTGVFSLDAMLSLVRTLVVGALAFLAIAVATYHLATWVSPPRTSDGHPVMPLGHAIVGALAGGVAATAAMIGDRAWQRRQRDRKPF
jgi:hypothetical protein